MAIADVSKNPLADLVSLKGRVAVVTGAAAGIGNACARRLAEAGAAVVIADLNGERAEAAAAALRDGGAQAAAVQVNVADQASVSAAADAAVRSFGGLHIWANCAGIYPIHDTLEMAEADWDTVLGVNLKGSFFGAREAAKRMIAADAPGVVINIHSTTAHKIPSPGLAHYIASKGAVESLTRALALELGPKGVRVLAVSPTMVATEGMMEQKPMLTEAFGNIGDPHIIYGSRLPLGRIGTPDDIARVVLFAASDLALIMTGSILFADAGDLVF